VSQKGDHSSLEQYSISYKDTSITWAWWHMPVILALKRLRLKNFDFEGNLGHIKPVLK
jgi:hypothetical protein